jgi:hypothetical protein
VVAEPLVEAIPETGLLAEPPGASGPVLKVVLASGTLSRLMEDGKVAVPSLLRPRW